MTVFPDISRYANNVDQEFMQAFTFTLKRKIDYKSYKMKITIGCYFGLN